MSEVDKRSVSELERCRKEIKSLQSQVKSQKDVINRLEEDKASLVTAMKLIMQDRKLVNHQETEKKKSQKSDEGNNNNGKKKKAEKKKSQEIDEGNNNNSI